MNLRNDVQFYNGLASEMFGLKPYQSPTFFLDETGTLHMWSDRQWSRISNLPDPVVVDYSAVSTITGWSSFTNKQILYLRIGKLMVVQFYLTGTSNSADTSFTLPFACNATVRHQAIIRVQDNGSSASGFISLAANSTTVNCYSNVGGAGWTDSGDKLVAGTLVFLTD
jgi:hypothetical protein